MLQSTKQNIWQQQQQFHIQPTFMTEGSYQSDSRYQDRISSQKIKQNMSKMDKADHQSYSSKLNNEAIDKIYHQIQNSQIKLSQSRKKHLSLSTMKDTTTKQYQSIDIQRLQILKKKDKIMEELKHIQLIQHDMNTKNMQQIKRKKKEKIDPSLNNQLIKVLKLKRKKYQFQMDNKILQYKEREQEDKVYDFQMEEKRKEERRMQKKQMAEKSLNKMKKRKRQLKENLDNSYLFYKKMKEQKPRYLKIQQQDKKIKEQIEQNFKKVLFDMKVQKSIDLHELKQHQLVYKKAKQLHQQQKLHNLSKSQMILSQTPKYTSIFRQNVLKQQKEKQASQVNKWNTIINNIEKNYIYSEHVRLQAKKQLKIKPSQPKKQEVNLYFFDRTKMLQKGKQNLKLARSLVNLKPKHVQQQSKDEQNKSHVKYINYLKEKPFNRTQVSSDQKMKRCLKEGNIDLALKAAGKTEKSLYKSMKAKLRLLQALQQDW